MFSVKATVEGLHKRLPDCHDSHDCLNYDRLAQKKTFLGVMEN